MCHAEGLELIIPRTREKLNSFRPKNDIIRLLFQKEPFCLHYIDELKQGSRQDTVHAQNDKDVN